MDEQRILEAITWTLECFADRFYHTNICDDWEDQVKDITREERDEARSIVESIRHHAEEVAEMVIAIYNRDKAGA